LGYRHETGIGWGACNERRPAAVVKGIPGIQRASGEGRRKTPSGDEVRQGREPQEAVIPSRSRNSALPWKGPWANTQQGTEEFTLQFVSLQAGCLIPRPGRGVVSCGRSPNSGSAGPPGIPGGGGDPESVSKRGAFIRQMPPLCLYVDEGGAAGAAAPS
jgi:hypothetical protein